MKYFKLLKITVNYSVTESITYLSGLLRGEHFFLDHIYSCTFSFNQ